MYFWETLKVSCSSWVDEIILIEYLFLRISLVPLLSCSQQESPANADWPKSYLNVFTAVQDYLHSSAHCTPLLRTLLSVCPPSAQPPDQLLASDWLRGRNTRFWLVERRGKGCPPIEGGRCNCRARLLLTSLNCCSLLTPYLISLHILPIPWR